MYCFLYFRSNLNYLEGSICTIFNPEKLIRHLDYFSLYIPNCLQTCLFTSIWTGNSSVWSHVCAGVYVCSNKILLKIKAGKWNVFSPYLWQNWCSFWLDNLLFFSSGSAYSAWSVIFLLSLKHSRTGNTAEIGLGLIAVASPDTHQRCHINLSNSLVLLQFMYKILLRPCLDAFKIPNFYFSSHHIESLNTCMEH
jgi:hypothetical protein